MSPPNDIFLAHRLGESSYASPFFSAIARTWGRSSAYSYCHPLSERFHCAAIYLIFLRSEVVEVRTNPVVIFDLDGTLIDTQLLYERCKEEIARILIDQGLQRNVCGCGFCRIALLGDNGFLLRGLLLRGISEVPEALPGHP